MTHARLAAALLATATTIGAAIAIVGPAAATPAAGPTPAGAAAAVWVIDDTPAPGVDFTQIQPAIAAASDGDVLLVRGGFYDPFTIDGKGLTVVADAGAFVAVNYTSQIRDLTREQCVVLRGLTLGPTSLALDILNCDGPVWVSDCVIAGDDTFGPGATKDALHVTNSARVILDGCVVTSPLDPYGENAAVASDATLAIWDSTFEGGFPDLPSTPGGVGLSLDGGALFASGSTFIGGTGGDGGDWGAPSCFDGGPGGAGLALTGADAVLRDCAAAGGPGGSSLGTSCAEGPIGTPITQQETALTLFATPSRSVDLPRVLRASATVDLTFSGEPGDLATLFLGFEVAPADTSKFEGVIVPGPPFTIVAGLPLGATGALEIPVTVPALPPGFDAVVVVGQALFTATGGDKTLGAPLVSVVLAPGF